MTILHLSAKQLRQAAVIKEKIVTLQKQLEQLSGSELASAPVRKKRKLSAASRAKIAAAQKTRWAKQKGSKPASVPTSNPGTRKY